MRAFYLAWTEEIARLPRPVAEVDGQNLPQPVAEIPWGHNVWLLEKVKDPVERLWYAQRTLLHGWSRPVLVSSQVSENPEALSFEQAAAIPVNYLTAYLLVVVWVP